MQLSRPRPDYCGCAQLLLHLALPANIFDVDILGILPATAPQLLQQRHMLCRSASLPRTALQVPLRVPAAVMCGSAKGSATATAVTWPETPLANGQYAKELESACLAVQLASKLCRTVQQQLKSSETAGKQDDSPVTVADYGACCQLAVMSLDQGVCQLIQCTSSRVQLYTVPALPVPCM